MRSPSAFATAWPATPKAEGERLLPADTSSRQQQVRGGLAPDDCGKRHREGEAVVKTESGKVGAEAAGRGPHPEVRRECEAEATSDRRSLHGRHDGERRRKESQRLAVELCDVLSGVGGEVEAGAEVLSLGGQHDGTAPIGAVELVVRVGNLTDDCRVEEIVRWPAESDHAHVLAVLFDGDPVTRSAQDVHTAMSSRLRQ